MDIDSGGWWSRNPAHLTILARGNGKGGVCAIQHPDNHRRMTIREQASIQTFPLEFEFVGAMNSCYRQVGNAVPVLFGQCLGMMLPKKPLIKSSK
jgi:DNA (cytosine-5)-methyltransferase 1